MTTPWPQLILLSLMMIGFGLTAAKHGNPDTHDGWASLIGNTIVLSLLWWGGFFDPLLR